MSTGDTPVTTVETNNIDYKGVDSFTKRYLETYYTDIDPDEYEVAKFLVREYPKIASLAADGREPHMLEIGCGPTIHHSLPAVPYITSLEMADYLQSNIDQIALWKTKNPNAHNWEHFVKTILILEGKVPSEVAIQERENALQKQMRDFYLCDVLRANPLLNSKTYPVVGFFYCAEEATVNIEEWKHAIKHVTDLVEPGGLFFHCALNDTEYYTIVSPDGEPEKLPCCRVTREDYLSLLPSLGFTIENTVLEIAETPTQAHQGINGVILISAKKDS